jgi:hypothetical protein
LTFEIRGLICRKNGIVKGMGMFSFLSGVMFTATGWWRRVSGCEGDVRP